ncbi:MAG: hypothetical protein ACKKMS_00185 [Candidatus Nealsonbacteria bacterium]
MGEHYEMEIIYNEFVKSEADIKAIKKLLEKWVRKKNKVQIQVIVEKWETKGGKNEEALEADIRHRQGIKETN